MYIMPTSTVAFLELSDQNTHNPMVSIAKLHGKNPLVASVARIGFEFCLARCRDVGSDYNIFFFLFLFLTRHHPAWSLGIQCVHACAQCQYAKQLESHARSKG